MKTPRIGWWRGSGALSAVLLLALACGKGSANPDVSGTSTGAGAAGASGTSTGASGTSAGVAGGTQVGGFGGSDGGSAATAGNAGTPFNVRPEPPEWVPSFQLGTPGWRGSQASLCETRQGPKGAFTVWADERGVFILLAASCAYVGRDLPTCPLDHEVAAGTSLQFNDGTGWRSLVEDPYLSAHTLTGFPAGNVLLGDASCGVTFVDVQGQTTCANPPLTGASSVFVVNAALAFAVNGNDLLRYDEGNWAPIAVATDIGPILWANDEIVLLRHHGGISQISRQGTDLHALPQLPIGDYQAAWGFSSTDLWFGNSLGHLVHYDGASWQIFPIGGKSTSSSALWGQAGQLFFTTDYHFGRVRDMTVELLLTAAEGTSFDDVGGLSPNEVFLTVSDRAYDAYACGGSFALWFDGTEFHRF